MPAKLNNDILAAAIEGFEARKKHIDVQIAELRQLKNGGSSEPTATPEPGRERRKMSAAGRKRIAEAQRKSVELAVRLAQDAPAPVRILNIGGGLGIPYFPGDERLDVSLVARNLAAILQGLDSRLPGVQVVLELGRFLVGEAGIYVCRVIDRKISRGHCFLVTDGGLHHHLAASGNFGQVIRKNYPVAVGNRVRGSKREIVSVVGPLCTPLDLLADNMEMASAEVGDLIVVFQSGAYGLSASPAGFLSHPPAAEILV